MNEFVEKLIERLEEEKGRPEAFSELNTWGLSVAISIVKELAEEYNQRKKYRIVLYCFEGDTEFELYLTKLQYKFLLTISNLTEEKSENGCMPAMFVEPKGE